MATGVAIQADGEIIVAAAAGAFSRRCATTWMTRNWKDSQQAELEAIGLQPDNDNDLEAAVIATLAPANTPRSSAARTTAPVSAS